MELVSTSNGLVDFASAWGGRRDGAKDFVLRPNDIAKCFPPRVRWYNLRETSALKEVLQPSEATTPVEYAKGMGSQCMISRILSLYSRVL